MIRIYNQEEIEILREGGKRLAQIVKALAKEIRANKTGKEVDDFARDLFKKSGGKPSFLNYQGFPAAVCISVNNEVVHTAPMDGRFKDGDIVGLDVGMNYGGYHTDMAITLPVGKIDNKTAGFVMTAKAALGSAIKVCKPKATTGDVGYVVQNFVEKKGYSVVRELAGHGVGKKLHMDPSVPNYGKKGSGITLKKGMILAIEPIINMGKADIISEKKKHCIRTKDNSLSAHFEHTVLITEKGAEILTQP